VPRVEHDRNTMALPTESVNIMSDSNPRTTFRGLPLSEGQEREIRHYIHTKERHGLPWDTPELQAMLRDMLDPPQMADHDFLATEDSMAAERATAQHEESLEADHALPAHAR
jgi:hypothetical protein